MARKPLTPRQEQVARLVAGGLSTARAAAQLGIARTTADTLLQAAYARTRTRDRAGLVRWLADLPQGLRTL